MRRDGGRILHLRRRRLRPTLGARTRPCWGTRRPATALRVSRCDFRRDPGRLPTTVAYGEEIRLSLWNVSTERRHTGVRDKWSLQILTTEGWRHVRGTTDDDPLPYPDLALIRRPRDWMMWTIELTERAILEGHLHEDTLEVCPELRSGRYRFVYLAAAGDAVAVEFDLKR